MEQGQKRIKTDDIIFFANQLAVMVDTGIPLSEALDSIASTTEHDSLALLIGAISDDVKGGSAFSEALEKHPKYFTQQFVAMMRASEASGTMGQMLERMANYMMQDRDTRKQIKGAMVYPICMLSFCVLVVVGLLIFVLPRFENIYSSRGAALPVPTQILLTASKAITQNWVAILIGLVVVGVGGTLFFRSRTGVRVGDKLKIMIPAMGPMFRKGCLARSLRTMSTMITTGVNVIDGLDITARVAGNTYYAELWESLQTTISEGGSLSDGLHESPLIPGTIAQMIEAGERSGKLGTVMDRVAKFCEDDLRIAVKTLTGMIEPIMIIVMGLIIGGIAMALLLPIFNMSKAMHG
jgi:type IV pilus assembly protein PilC